jgi:hypothetical protein
VAGLADPDPAEWVALTTRLIAAVRATPEAPGETG